MTPFLRLGLFAASALIAGALAWVALEWSPWIALAALAGGMAFAVIATIESVPEVPAEAEAEPSDELAPIRRRDRKDIERAAAASRERGD